MSQMLRPTQNRNFAVLHFWPNQIREMPWFVLQQKPPPAAQFIESQSVNTPYSTSWVIYVRLLENGLSYFPFGP